MLNASVKNKIPKTFPCNSLYANFDYLIFRAKSQGVNSQLMDVYSQLMDVFPWIMWYIWKVGNEKIFSDKDITPMDSTQIAIKEAESWRVAQCATEIFAIEGEDRIVETNLLRQPSPSGRWRCQVDASPSWIRENGATGLGFVLLDEELPILFGSRGNTTAATPLHAEAEGLIWAMQELIKKGRREIHFQSDCEQLVKLIRTVMEWPALEPELDEIKALSLEFVNFSVNSIARSLNVRVDGLAKGGRVRVIKLLC